MGALLDFFEQQLKKALKMLDTQHLCMKDTEIPNQRCWKCGYRMDRTTEVLGDAKPREGDVSMCLDCGALGIFTKNLMIRKPTEEEQARWEVDPLIVRAQILRVGSIGDALRGRK